MIIVFINERRWEICFTHTNPQRNWIKQKKKQKQIA